jgi:hypothetical protein
MQLSKNADCSGVFSAFDARRVEVIPQPEGFTGLFENRGWPHFLEFLARKGTHRRAGMVHRRGDARWAWLDMIGVLAALRGAAAEAAAYGHRHEELARYALRRASRRAADVGCHAPPRGVTMPRSFS